MRVLKSELFKMTHKKDIYIICLCLIGFAILFSYMMGSNSDTMIITGLDKMGAMFFSVFLYNYTSGLFLFQIITAVTVTGIWAAEFSNGTIATTITKAKSRRQVFIQKSLVALTYSIIYLIILFVAGWIFYSTIGSTSQYYTTDFMFNMKGDLIGLMITMLLSVLFCNAAVTLFSMMESQIKALLLYLVTLIVMKVLERVEAIRSFVPTYLTGSNLAFSNEWNTALMVKSIVIILIWSGLLYAASLIIFKKKNIS
jgi:hypothetical protein